MVVNLKARHQGPAVLWLIIFKQTDKQTALVAVTESDFAENCEHCPFTWAISPVRKCCQMYLSRWHIKSAQSTQLRLTVNGTNLIHEKTDVKVLHI